MLTSNTRTFQIGRPSFRMGAAGARKLPFAFASSASVGSTASLRLRIFLMDTVSGSAGSKQTNSKQASHTNLLLPQRSPSRRHGW